jgi:hypothetical protein
MEKGTSTTDSPATDEQQDHLKSLGVWKIPKDLTLRAASVWIAKLHERETTEHGEMRMSLTDYGELETVGDQIQNRIRKWRIMIWTAILLAILGIGCLIHLLVRASGTMLR